MQKEDEGIQAVRDVREMISAEFDEDPDKLVDHYVVVQERHSGRLVQRIATHHTATTGHPRSVADQQTS